MSAPEKETELVPHPPLKKYYAEEKQRRQFVSELFDKTAHQYDWVIKAMSFGSGNWYRNDALLRAGLKKDMSALDVATGTGPVAISIKKIVGENGSVIGLDRSINMLTETKRNLQLDVVQSDAAALPFPDKSFDYVILLEVIEHLYNPQFVINEISRILKPGCSFIISTPNILNIGSRMRFLFEGSFDFFREPILDYSKVFPGALQNMHVIAWRYHELEYLLYRNNLLVDKVHTDSIKSSFKFLAKVSSSSTAITFFAFFTISKVTTPGPDPISNTTSSFEISVAFIILSKMFLSIKKF